VYACRRTRRNGCGFRRNASGREVEFLGAKRRIGFPATAGRTAPLELTSLETAGCAPVTSNATGVSVDQLLDQLDVVTLLRVGLLRCSLEQLLQPEHGGIAAQLPTHELIGCARPMTLDFPAEHLIHQVKRRLALQPGTQRGLPLLGPIKPDM